MMPATPNLYLPGLRPDGTPKTLVEIAGYWEKQLSDHRRGGRGDAYLPELAGHLIDRQGHAEIVMIDQVDMRTGEVLSRTLTHNVVTDNGAQNALKTFTAVALATQTVAALAGAFALGTRVSTFLASARLTTFAAPARVTTFSASVTTPQSAGGPMLLVPVPTATGITSADIGSQEAQIAFFYDLSARALPGGTETITAISQLVVKAANSLTWATPVDVTSTVVQAQSFASMVVTITYDNQNMTAGMVYYVDRLVVTTSSGRKLQGYQTPQQGISCPA